MADDYYASFGTVDLTRLEVLDRTMGVLKAFGAQFDVDLFELQLVDGRFEYTNREIQDRSIWYGLERTVDWQGIEFHMTLFERGCSMLFLNSQSANTTVVFVEPAGLISDQAAHPLLEVMLFELLAKLVDALNANFCVVEPGWTCRERTLSDIEVWARDTSVGRPRDWVHVLLVQGDWSERIWQYVSSQYERRAVGRLLWFHKKRRTEQRS